MLSFEPSSDFTQNYKFLIGSIVPRPIAVVSTLNDDGTFNVMFEDGDTKNNVSIEHIKNCVQVDLDRFDISVIS